MSDKEKELLILIVQITDLYDLITRKIKTPWYTKEEIAIYNEVLNLLKPIIKEK